MAATLAKLDVSSAAALVGPSEGGADAENLPRHHTAPRRSWPWLPLQEAHTLAPHPYCQNCGVVRFIGSRRALDFGSLANLLARFEIHLRRNGRRLTEAQRRLIAKRLEALAADDTFALSRDGQLRLLAEVVGKQLGLDAEVVASYLRSC